MARRTGAAPHAALVLAVAVGCASFPRPPARAQDDPGFAQTVVPTPRGMEEEQPLPFALQPGDTLHYRMVSTDPLEGNAVVDGAGIVHIPIAGRVQVAGLGLEEAERAADAALRRLDRFGHVVLTVTDTGGHRATVLGSVARPGVVALRPGMRVAELVGNAGGARTGDPDPNAESTDDLADLDAARLVRDGRALPISIARALEGHPRHNIFVRPGDLLMVPAVRGRGVTVVGTVRTPRIVRFHAGLRLSHALALAGGVAERGDEGDIRVIRGPMSRPRVYAASLAAIGSGGAPDPELLPGDVLFVTQRVFFPTLADVLQTVIPLVATAVLTYSVFAPRAP